MGENNLGDVFKPEKQEFKVLGKIDLNQFDKYKKTDKRAEQKDHNEMLNAGLKNMAERHNNQHGYFVNSDGSVAMDSPNYKFSDKQLDAEYIVNKEIDFAAKTNKTREEWLRDREKARGIVTEKALTLLLDKVLRDDFIVVRTATYDDYRNGVDTLIVDKDTGAPICGVDEMGADDAHSYRNKGQKIYDIIGHNGAYVKYGATFKHDALQLKAIKNVPAFYLSLDEHDLDKLLPALAQNDVSAIEMDIFNRLLHSFDHQITTLYKDHINLKENPFETKNKLLLEQEDLKETFGEDSWSRSDEGRDWKARMGQNNMRLNLLNFQRSLEHMKEVYQKIKKS